MSDDDTSTRPLTLFLLHDRHSIANVLRGYRPLNAQRRWIEGHTPKWGSVQARERGGSVQTHPID